MKNKIKIIAETAWHHEGDFEFMKKLVKSIVEKSNADFIKLHITLDLDSYMDKTHPLFGTLKKWMFREAQWVELLNMVMQSDKSILLLVNDMRSIDFGLRFNPKLIEVHSVCLNDINLLEKLSANISHHQKIVLGVGGSDLYEIENAIETLNHNNLVLMFGFQNYPTKFEDLNFQKIRRIMKLFPDFEFGYADHTSWDNENNILMTLLGAMVGMQYVEKHVTTDFGLQRCDWEAAVTVDMLNEIATKLLLIESINGNSLLQLNEAEKKYSTFGPSKKAALLVRNVKAGEELCRDMIVFKRTLETTDCSQLEIISKIGKKLSADLEKNTVLRKNHFVN